MDPSRWKINWRNLPEDLKRTGSIAAVAEAYGCRPSTVGRMALKLGLEELLPFSNREWLYHKYVTEHLSQQAIADMCSVGRQTIGLWLVRFGIETRALSKIQRVPVPCIQCGKVVMAKPHTVATKKYCSRSCRIKYRVEHGLQINAYTVMGNGRSPTKVEEALAPFLPDFRREYCVRPSLQKRRGGSYRLDFAHLRLKIDVELDGSSHDDPEKAIRDERRDAFLTAQGWTVLRFKNAEVLNETDRVLAIIRSTQARLTPRPEERKVKAPAG